MIAGRMSSRLRLGLFYFAVYLGTGANSPYIGLFFAERGLTGAQIGMILAAPMLARALTGPTVAVWADGFTLRRTPLALLSLAAMLFYAAVAGVHGFWAWLAIWFCTSTCYAALQPLADVIALKRARLERFNYGWSRSFGSISFILANFGCGALLAFTGPSVVLAWTATAAGLVALSALRLPDDRVHDGGARLSLIDRWRGAGALLADRRFMLAIVSCGFVLAGQAFYYGFSTLLWRRQGIPEALIGALWATGVVIEIVFMWGLGRIARRMGPAMLLGLGAVLALIRWTAYAFSPPLWALWPLQTLHAGSFAMAWIASLQFVERFAPPHAASAAQMLNSAIPLGLMIGLATLASGPLFDAFGARGYLAMAGLAVVGLCGAVALARTART